MFKSFCVVHENLEKEQMKCETSLILDILFSRRNWHWDEPSCGVEMCAVLYYQPSALPDDDGHFLFHWNDDNCDTKNNFVCKYPEGKSVPLCQATQSWELLTFGALCIHWFLNAANWNYIVSNVISKMWLHSCQ